jgi:hypothetical protein
MVWGAFEVIATDTTIEVLNRRPARAIEALAAETWKRLGLSKGISLDTLQSFSFDVSSSMGTILFGERRLDSLRVISAVCNDIYRNDTLETKLKSTSLWALSQRRNLIVHRRGIIDTQYLAKTPDDLPLGESIAISGTELKGYLVEIRDLGLEIAGSAAALLQNPR